MTSDVETAYSARASEYITRVGSMDAVHASDLQLVTAWAAQVDGPILDAGCGPGQWTGYLAGQGADARGIDEVGTFIDHARATHPDVDFQKGSIDALPQSWTGFGGILAWYSLIHHDPQAIHRPLNEFARILRPGGALLVGFFTGSRIEPFDHTVTQAWRWPPEALAERLIAAGFEVVEIHTRVGAHAKPRPHGAILAQLPNVR